MTVAPAPRVAARPSSAAAHRRCLRLAVLGLWECLLALWLTLCVVLLVVWVGVYLVPAALGAVRRVAQAQRRLAAGWSGTEIAESYDPLPDGDGLADRWRGVLVQVQDPAVRRDLLWVLLDPFVGALLVALPVTLLLNAVWGVVLMVIWRPVVRAGGTEWFLFVPVSDQASAVVGAAVGLASGVLGWFLARPVVRWHGRWARARLSPPASSLERRVDELARSRADAVDDASAEVRRIERDLHDGAQARIVAMGMTLTAAERLMDSDPAAARAMLADAKASSSAALRELRDLVRGIHPPVLADRGLVDAIRTIALESALPVQVTSTLDERVAAPVESAVYFAVSELLANVTKHAHAAHARVDVARTPGALTVVVADDGVGGARVEAGSGLAGIARRLGAFDGTLTLDAPGAGGTVATIRVPLPPPR